MPVEFAVESTAMDARPVADSVSQSLCRRVAVWSSVFTTRLLLATLVFKWKMVLTQAKLDSAESAEIHWVILIERALALRECVNSIHSHFGKAFLTKRVVGLVIADGLSDRQWDTQWDRLPEISWGGLWKFTKIGEYLTERSLEHSAIW